MNEAKRTGSPQRPRSLAKRAEVLRAAADLFLEHGYDGVSVDMIVASAGGTKTNVYVHFGGKAELFAAVVEELWRESVQPFAEVALLDTEGLPIEEALRHLGRGFLNAICTDREIKLHRMVVAAAAQHSRLAHRWFSIGPLEAYQRFSSYVAKQQLAGRLVAMPARRLAPMFVDMVSQEMHMRMLIGGARAPKRSEINRVVDDAVDIFLYGAISRPGVRTKRGGKRRRAR